MNRVLACVDLSDFALTVVEAAAAIAACRHAELCVLYVAGPRVWQAMPNDSAAERVRDARQKLEDVQEAIAARHELPEITMLLLEGSNTAARILDEAHRLQPNVMVLGIRGREASRRSAVGTTVEGVLGANDFPLLLIPLGDPFADRRSTDRKAPGCKSTHSHDATDRPGCSGGCPCAGACSKRRRGIRPGDARARNDSDRPSSLGDVAPACHDEL